MRAKLLLERSDFTRGAPKGSLGIGGTILAEKHKEVKEWLSNSIREINEEAQKRWDEYLENLLLGKTITADMTRMAITNMKGNIKEKVSYNRFTIKVEDIRSELDSPWIVVSDGERLYAISEDTKIYIDES